MKQLLTIMRRAAYAAVGFALGVLLMPVLPFYVAVCGWTIDEEVRDGE